MAAAIDHAMPNCRGARIVRFLQLIQGQPQCGFVIGNSASLIRNGVAVGIPKPQMARVLSDVFGLTVQEKALTRAAEFVLSKLQRRRSAIEGEDVMGIHE